jgi:uncharacterized RDD family membrane protein YckC
MTVRCPRCAFANAMQAKLCARCAAPLTLPDERGKPPPLRKTLDLDRRTPPPLPIPRGRDEPTPTPSTPARPPARQSYVPPPGSQEDETLRGEAVGALVLRRAASWRRAAAWVVDGAILWAFAWLVWWVGLLVSGLSGKELTRESGLDGLVEVLDRATGATVATVLLLTIAAFVYSTLLHAHAGATLGKRLLGIRVVNALGRPPSMRQSAFRAGFALLSTFALAMGLVLALFNRSGRALHDLLTRTYVIEPR